MSFSLFTQIGSDIDGEAAYDLSGQSVSLSADGSIVAIGAPWNDGNGDGEDIVDMYVFIKTFLEDGRRLEMILMEKLQVIIQEFCKSFF